MCARFPRRPRKRLQCFRGSERQFESATCCLHLSRFSSHTQEFISLVSLLTSGLDGSVARRSSRSTLSPATSRGNTRDEVTASAGRDRPFCCVRENALEDSNSFCSSSGRPLVCESRLSDTSELGDISKTEVGVGRGRGGGRGIRIRDREGDKNREVVRGERGGNCPRSSESKMRRGKRNVRRRRKLVRGRREVI